MSKLLDAQKDGYLQRSLEIVNDLVARFSTSPLIRDARKKIR